MDERIVDPIYEAAVLPDLWSGLLESLADRFGAKGGLLFASHAGEVKWLGGGPVTHAMREYLAQGWAEHNPRPQMLIQRAHPGFLTELDIMSERDTYELPIYKKFLRPSGYFATAGTYVAGLAGDMMILSIEGFQSHQASRNAVADLDLLRPHLARAVQLSSQFRLERMRGQVEAMEAIGAAACVVSTGGRLQATNALFLSEIGSTFLEGRTRLSVADARANHLFLETLRKGADKSTFGCSIPLRDTPGRVRVLHVIPVKGRANDLFSDAFALLVLTNVGGPTQVSTDVIQDLFDLTAAEARVAARLCRGGASLKLIAKETGVSLNTVKTQLQAVYAKTGTNKQLDLVRILLASQLPPIVR